MTKEGIEEFRLFGKAARKGIRASGDRCLAPTGSSLMSLAKRYLVSSQRYPIADTLALLIAKVKDFFHLFTAKPFIAAKATCVPNSSAILTV